MNLLVKVWNARLYQTACGVLWAVALVALPITSYPLLLELTGSSTVAPPTVFLLLALAVVWLAPYLLGRGKLPIEAAPLFLFLGVVVASWAAAFFGAFPPFKDRVPLSEAKEAFATLAMAATAFLVPAAWLSAKRSNGEEVEARFTWALRWINLGGALLIAWSLVQGVYVLFLDSKFPSSLFEFQWLFSGRGDNPLMFGRATGFAYEPSWLAHQLNLLYLPLWLSATLHGFSAYRRRLWKISAENVLLAGGLATLGLSFSRIGWIAFALIVTVVVIGITVKLVGRLRAWLLVRLNLAGRAARWSGPLLFSGLLIVVFALYVGAAVGVVRLAAELDWRIARLVRGEWMQEADFYVAINQLAFAERVAYWHTGFQIFGEHPLLGVGLGNAGFYFPRNMPYQGWGLPEISQVIHYLPGLPNTKSLWARLLAETGLAGFAVFLGWCWLLARSALYTRRSPNRLLQTLGTTGLFVLLAFLVEGFSVDSFALPYFWLPMGIVAAAGFAARHSPSSPSLR